MYSSLTDNDVAYLTQTVESIYLNDDGKVNEELESKLDNIGCNLRVAGYDDNCYEKDVYSYKDNRDSDNNSTPLDKWRRVNAMQEVENRERISSPSSDDSSSTIEGAAGGIPYNLIIKDKLNEKQRRRKQKSLTSDRMTLTKRNMHDMKERSEYLRSPSSDTSDEDFYCLKSFILCNPAHRELLDPENILDLNDHINSKLKVKENKKNTRSSTHISSHLHPMQNHLNPIQTRIQDYYRSNIGRNYSSNSDLSDDLSCSARERVNNSRRGSSNQTQNQDNQNHHVSGGARPKKL